MHELYGQGVIDRCAELGVDPERLVKLSAKGDIVRKGLSKLRGRNLDRMVTDADKGRLMTFDKAEKIMAGSDEARKVDVARHTRKALSQERVIDDIREAYKHKDATKFSPELAARIRKKLHMSFKGNKMPQDTP